MEKLKRKIIFKKKKKEGKDKSNTFDKLTSDLVLAKKSAKEVLQKDV